MSLLDPEIRGLEILQPEEEPVLYITHATHGPVLDVQLFVTTHSLEAIDALLAADTTPEQDVVAFKLGRGQGQSTVKRYGEEQLKWMRFERGLEVR